MDKNKTMGKNKTINGGERTLILRVLHYFEKEKRKGDVVIPVKKALKRTCAATGVSLSTITRIKREEKKILRTIPPSPASPSSLERASTLALTTPNSVVILPTPGKKRNQPAHNKIEIDDYTICSLRNLINSFHTERQEVPTLRKILEVAKADLNFPGQKETLRKILHEKLGYTFKQRLKKRDGVKMKIGGHK